MTKSIKSSVPFFIHSTFRNFVGKQVKPHGLEWGLDGDSHMTYVPSAAATNLCSASGDGSNSASLPDDCWTTPESHRGIVEAYNRWAYVKELEFKTTEDILSVTLHKDGTHVQVKWREENHQATGGDVDVDDDVSSAKFTATMHDDMRELLKKDPAAAQGGGGAPPAEVWINGVYEGTLHGEMSLSPLLLAIQRVTGPGTRMTYYRHEKPSLIRIEKYFRGMLRKHQVFEHIMDNLIALEDPEVLDSKTLIGTATVGDWIMGGQLTTRLHVEELENGDIKFVRPLYHDDVSTADRHFGLFKGRDDVKIAIVRKELERLRYLASLKHPFVPQTWGEKDSKHANDEGASQPKMNGVTMLMDRVPDAMDFSSASSSVVFLEDIEESSAALSYARSTFSD